MESGTAVNQVKLTPRYFKVALHHFGRTPELRRAILEGTGVAEENLRDESYFVGLDQQLRQQDNLGRLFGEDWAISAPELWSLPTFGQAGAASQAAVNLRQALEIIANSSASIGPMYRYYINIGNSISIFEYNLLVDMEEKYYRRSIEVGFIGMRSLFYLYLSRPPTGVKYLFSSAKHEYASRVREVLGGEVEFGAPNNAIEFPTSWLELESPLRDMETLRLACQRLEAENRALSNSGSVRARVEYLLRDEPNGRAKLPEIARSLGVSQRTLVRRLSGEGATFRELLDTEIERRAEKLMEPKLLKVAAVAERLGYGDPPSFARARRRWAKRKKGHAGALSDGVTDRPDRLTP